jgi:hypothetical protein
MYTATVSPSVNSQSLRTLVNAAVPGQIPGTFNGRCFQVILTALTGTPAVTGVLGSPPPAGSLAPLVVNVPTSFNAVTNNQISIDEIYLVAPAAATVAVEILVM